MTRIDQLRQFIKDDPTDEFPRYALALEYLHTDPQLARKEFESLLNQFPEYLPAYYPAAHLMIDLGEDKKAEALFLQGMEIAQRQQNNKTNQELKAAYNQWLYDRP